MEKIYSELNQVFQDIFDDVAINLTSNTTANDVDGWDSLSHTLIILAIEKHYKIRFTTKEILGFSKVGDMVECIQQKLNLLNP